MDPSERIAELLTEIREIQQAHYAEYQRTSQEHRELSRANAEQYEAANEQYQASARWGRTWIWGLCLLIGFGFAANLIVLVQVRGAVEAIRAAVEKAPNGPLP